MEPVDRCPSLGLLHKLPILTLVSLLGSLRLLLLGYARRRANWIREVEKVEEEEVREVVAREPKSVEEAFEKLEDCKGDVEIPKDIDQRFFFPGEGLEYFQKNLFEAD